MRYVQVYMNTMNVTFSIKRIINRKGQNVRSIESKKRETRYDNIYFQNNSKVD